MQSAASAQLIQCSQVHKEHALCTDAWKSALKADLQAEPMVIDEQQLRIICLVACMNSGGYLLCIRI